MCIRNEMGISKNETNHNVNKKNSNFYTTKIKLTLT